MPEFSPEIHQQLQACAETADTSLEWPSESWRLLLRPEILNVFNSTSEGPRPNPVSRLTALEELAASCLTTAFALSQHGAAVRQLERAPESIQRRFLPAWNATTYMSVGLSQLTTSRQHQAPVLLATPQPHGAYLLNGDIPWVTGADQARYLIIGATLESGEQILTVLPMDLDGITIHAPLKLAAVCGARTSPVHCDNVRLTADLLLAGPKAQVLGTGGGGGLETSCLAIGLAGAAINSIAEQVSHRPYLQGVSDRLTEEWNRVRSWLYHLAEFPPSDPGPTHDLRRDATRLVLRSTQAALMIAKGAGFLSPQAPQRWVRQAMFFLVWSCPQPIAASLLSEFADFPAATGK